MAYRYCIFHVRRLPVNTEIGHTTFNREQQQRTRGRHPMQRRGEMVKILHQERPPPIASNHNHHVVGISIGSAHWVDDGRLLFPVKFA